MTRFLHHWPMQSILNSPTHFEALIYINPTNSKAPTRFRNTDVFAFHGDANVAPLVLGLPPLRYPGAVIGIVAAAIVQTFQAPSEARSFAHVGEEGLKAVNPSLANRDAPSAVSVILGMRFPKASRLHRLPTDVGETACQAVRPLDERIVFATEAATTDRSAISGPVNSSDMLVSAIAAEEPGGVLPFTPSGTNGSQTAEPHAGVVLTHATYLQYLSNGGNP